MKNKVLTFIIGVLVGAIITTVGFLIYNKAVKNNSEQPEMMQMNENGQMVQPSNGDMGEPPEMPNSNNGEEPPEKPSNDNGEEPPAKPEDSNTNTNS